MNINTDVYGDAASWYYSPAFNSTLTTFFNNNEALLNAFKASPPKTVNFGGTDNSEKGMLSRGISENKTPANVAIDNSIVAIGQDPAVSPFGKMKCVQFVSRSGWTPTRTITEIEKTAPINVFFATWQGTSSYYDNMTAWAFRVDSNANSIWAPNSNATNNPNMRVFPLASYGAKSLLLTPMVFSTANDIGGAQNGNWRTLNAWRDNYSNEYAYAIALKVQVVNSITASTIGYGSTGFSTTQRITAALWDSIGDNDNTHIDYCFTYDTITAMGNMLFLMKYFGYNAPVVQNQITTHWQGYFPNVDLFDHCEFKQTWSLTTSAVEIVRWGYKIGYSDNNYNVIMKWAALFGAPFTPTGKTSFGTMFNDSDLYFPIIDDNGIAHGEYTHGVGNLTNPFNDLNTTRDTGYDPTAEVDPNTYSSQTYFNPVLNLSSMCKRYVLNDAAVEQLCRDLWKISDDLIHTDPNEDFKDYDQLMLDNFLVNSPIDVIVSLDKYPISDIPTGTTAEPIKYGKASGAALGKPLTVNTIFFNFAGVDIYPKFGRSFLDYSPYTTYELYIPFCGVIQIDAGDIMDHTLSVQMVMDLSTGAVTAYVMADNLCIETANGSAALNIPVSGIDSITLNAQINNALISAKSAQMQARSTGTLTGRIAGGLKSVKESLNPKTATMQKATDTWAANLADYELTHQQLNPHKIGSASAACSWSLELTCRLMIYYPEGDAIDSSGGVSQTSPKLADLTLYGHTTGFSCISSGAVSNYHGFTVGNIDTSSISGATEQERDMIKSLFARGVYLP